MNKIKFKLKTLFRSQGFRNTFWNVFANVFYPFLLLLSTPLFIEKLGVTEFGIWILVNGITQTMSIFNMGLGDANIRYISKYNSQKNYQDINSVISTTFGLSILIVVLTILFGSSLSYVAMRVDWMDIPKDNGKMILLYLNLSFLLFGMKFLEIIILSIFQGFDRYDIFSKISLGTKSVILMINIIGVFLGANLTFIFISSAFAQLLFLLLEIYFVKRNFYFISLKPILDTARIKEIFSFSFWTWLQSVLAVVSAQADKFVVAYFSGVQTLSYYSIGYMIMTQIHSVFSSAAGWLFPVVSAKVSTKISVKNLLINSQALLLTCGFLSIIVALLIQEPLFTLWLGVETYEKSERFITLFIYYNLPLLLNILPFYFLNGSGNAKYNTYSELVMRLVGIIAMVSMFIWIGNEGLIWGGIVSMLLSVPIKTSLMWRYVVFEKIKRYGIDPVIGCTLLILFFEGQGIIYKSAIMVLFVLLFYLIYIRPVESLREFKKWS